MTFHQLCRLALAGAISLSMPALAAGVTVQIKLAAADALEVSYEVPANCNRLPFLQTGRSYREFRASWRADGDCGKLDGEGIEASCRTVRFRVPASTANLGGFPGAFPMGEGIWLHTAKYAVANSCGKVSYRLVAPGSIAFGGKLHHGEANSAEPSAADTSALLLLVNLPASDGPAMYFSPTLNLATVARIREVARDSAAFFGAAMPLARFRPNLLTATSVAGAGGVRYEGDADDILRLAFFNWPAGLDQQRQLDVTRFVSHEMSHRFQLRDEIDAYPNARLIHEGGAEFMRWVLAIRKGWMTPAEAAAELDNALAGCMLATGTLGWADMSPKAIGSRRLEYLCGLPAYVYVLAARQGTGTGLSRVDHFYQQVRNGAAPDFAHALECGDSAQCAPRWLPRLLGGGPSMASEWSRFLGATQLARPVAPTGAQRDVMMQQALGQLMISDCGTSSFFPTKEGVIIDDVKTCKTLQPKMHITQVEGFPMFGNADALPALVAACSAGGNLRLGTQAGQTRAVACSKPAYQPARTFYAADIERIIAGLESTK